MPANAPKVVSAQQQIDSTLHKVDRDLRELARCLQRAPEAKGTEASAALLGQVETMLARLQQHRTCVRQWATQRGVAPQVQGKLSAARTRIESETRKARDVQQELAANRPHQDAATAEDAGADDSAAQTPIPSVSVSETRPSDAEVKVLVEQLQQSPQEGDVEAEFVCRICQVHVVGCQPKLTRCSHLFCGDCISKWFAVQPSNQTWAGRAQAAGVPCPVCKEPLHGEADLHTVCSGGQRGSDMLWKLLSATRIVCANNPRCNPEGRCDWAGDYASYQRHIQTCGNAPLCAECAEVPAAQEEVRGVPEAAVTENFTAQLEGDKAALSAAQCHSDSEGTTCSDPFASEDSEAEEGPAQLSAAPQKVDGEIAEPAQAQEPSLTSLIQELLELRAPQQLLPSKEDEAAQSLRAREADVGDLVVEEHVALPELSPTLPPGVFVMEAKAKKQCGAKGAKASDRNSRKAQESAKVAEAKLAYANQAAWASQAAQWRALQWQATQQARMAYAGQVAQWQMAQATRMQAARAAWLAQAAA